VVLAPDDPHRCAGHLRGRDPRPTRSRSSTRDWP
jgi:hypothetical protein